MLTTGTQLHTAITMNNIDQVNYFLINNTEDLNKNLHLYSTPIIHAISLNRFDIVKILLPHVSIDLKIKVWPIQDKRFTVYEWSIFKKREEISNFIQLYKRSRKKGPLHKSIVRDIFPNYPVISNDIFNKILPFII